MEEVIKQAASPFANAAFIVSDDHTHQTVESIARKDRA
jgi:hypothetical protein